MTVADNTSRNQYTATSGQTVFAYTFEIVDKDHVVVLKNGVALSEGTDYSVSNVGNDNGGNITLTSGATAGDIMTLYRDMPYSRTQNYTNSGDFLASEVNSDFDELWLAGEQTDRAFSQSIRKPIIDSDSISMELPKAVDRADTFLTFDSNGAVSVQPVEDGINPATITRDQFTGDGSTTLFTLTSSKGNERSVVIYIDGVYQESDSYNIAGFSLTFTEAPPLNSSIEVLLFKVYDITNIEASDVSVSDAGGYYTSSTVEGALQEVGADIAELDSGNYLNVKEFGAKGDGTTDDTTFIQNAINHASTHKIQTIFFPDGHYKYTTLRLYHDATDNPNFQETPNRDGRFVFLGTGRIAITDLRTYDGTSSTEGRLYGSVLESTSGGGGIIIDPTAAFDSKDARNFLGEKMTFIANNTTQIIEAKACPGLSFEFCSFKQLNNDGDGIIAQNAWYFTFTNCFLIGPDKDNATGTGIIGGTDFFAGQWNINQSLVDTWRDCVSYEKGEFVNVSFRDSAIQNANRYAIHGSGGVINQLLLDNTYFENVGVTGTSFVYGASNVIRNLVMQSNFILCGNNSGTSRITGPSVDLVNCDSFSLSGSYVYRMYTPVVRVGNTRNFTDISGRVENNFFRNDATIPRAYSGDNDRTEFGVPFTTASSVLTVTVDGVTKTLGVDYTVSGLGDIAGAVVTFTTAPSSGAAISIDATNLETYFLFEGKLPEFKNNIWTGFTSGLYDSSSIFKLFDDTSDYALNYQDGLYGVNSFTRLGLGDISVETGIASSPKGIAAGSDKTYYDLTHTIAGGLALTIPNNTGTSPNTKNNVPHGRMFIIKNNSASSDFIIVRNRSDFSTIQRLQRGMTGIFVLDAKGTGKFNLAGVFGGDDPIYDTVTALNSITVNEVTFDGTDGTSGQFLTTDGSGNLSFATATGTGINAVVQDTTPQLGGDLDLNGSDITGTGNLDFTGTINTALSVNSTGPDVKITGDTPALEFVESDNSGSRMRMAWATSGSFEPTLYQSLYGDTTSTFGGITIQTRASDGSGNQVVYTYDPIGDRNWWGTRAAGDVRMQLQSDGTFNVRGGDVVFENSGATSDDFFWDASTSRLGLGAGATSPSSTLDVGGELIVTGGGSGTILVNDEDSALCPTMTFTRNGGGTITNDFIKFKNSGGQVAAINAFGGAYFTANVGIGTTLPATDLHIGDGTTATPALTLQSTNTGSTRINMGDLGSYLAGSIVYDNSNNEFTFTRGGATAYEISGAHTWYTAGGSRAMDLDSSGNLLVGTTNINPHTSNTATDAGTSINPNGIIKTGRNQNPSLLVNRMGNDGLLAMWYRSGVVVGNISVTSSATTYNTSSDQRLKDNIVDAPSASDDIDAIQVRSFDWKADGSHQKYGMVAQELQTVAPYAVSEGDTEEDMMGVDYSKLVPMLVKEIQSLRARVAQLESK